MYNSFCEQKYMYMSLLKTSPSEFACEREGVLMCSRVLEDVSRSGLLYESERVSLEPRRAGVLCTEAQKAAH